MKRVAVVGAGIAGLAVAHSLRQQAGVMSDVMADVTLFEAGGHFGGHAHTVDVTLGGVSHGVDTGFLVFNERTYPKLIALFAELGVATVPSDMSFSVQWPATGFEWCGSSLNSVFAQRSNLARPAFWRMLSEIARFNKQARAIALGAPCREHTVGEFLQARGFSELFRSGYFMPMVACIWSCAPEQMQHYPLRSLLAFCHNHGLLQISQRPPWRTVVGGSRQYVRRIVSGLAHARLHTPVRRVDHGVDEVGASVTTDHGVEWFDAVVLACHSDQALALLARPSVAEQQVLGAIRYRNNRAVLHTDATLLPRRPLAWAAWNYEGAPPGHGAAGDVCLHYLINKLQPLPFTQPVLVSLNPRREPRPETVHAEYQVAHPVFDAGSLAAQARLGAIQGRNSRWFCGAWAGHGFHEDGLASGLAVVDALRQRWAQPSRRRAALRRVA